MSLVALKYGQHKKAYHAALEDQKYLKIGGLEVKILARAFRGFPNLKKLTIDDFNSNIGSRQLIRDFDVFKAADLLTCNGVYTVPSLIEALSEAGVWLSDLRIGPNVEFESDAGFEMSCYMPNLFLFSDFLSYPRRICSKAMSTAFCDPEARTHARKILYRLQTLEISELKDGQRDQNHNRMHGSAGERPCQ